MKKRCTHSDYYGKHAGPCISRFCEVHGQSTPPVENSKAAVGPSAEDGQGVCTVRAFTDVRRIGRQLPGLYSIEFRSPDGLSSESVSGVTVDTASYLLFDLLSRKVWFSATVTALLD